MRRFIVVGHNAVTSGDFKLDDLAGSAGRLDILLRCVNSAFFLSHAIRKDAEIYLVLLGEPNPPVTVRFSGAEVRYLNPDERSTGALVRNAILKLGEGEVRSSPGVYVTRRSFADVVADLAEKSELVYLKEDGEDVRTKGFAEDVTFVLSDHHDLSPEEEAVLLSHSPSVIRLGPASYHADHCIVLMNAELDRRSE